MRRRNIGVLKMKNPIKFVCIIISISFIVFQIIANISLPIISSPQTERAIAELREFGETVMRMLPEDLGFTLFLPSEEALRRDLRLNSNDSNSYATLTRVLGFSAVPRWVSWADLEYGKEKIYDSISGLHLFVKKDLKGMVVVNGVVSEQQMELKIGNVLVHLMDGVVMDADFEQSLQSEDDDQDGEKHIFN